ncbi:glycosyltransferase family 2 protein [Phormidesmis sp. 146-35]
MTPVAFLIFNRPHTTARVFEAIRQAKPTQLLVVADGPRSNRTGEAEQCAAVRAIIDQVDWDCDVLKNYSDINLGCKQRVSTGLDWVFEQVEEAIILEDDCLPDSTFFPFCEALLDRYRDDLRIMAIAGSNFQFGRRRMPHSYYFSCYPHIWGWATWRRAWQQYDLEMQQWETLRDDNWLNDWLGDKNAARYWTKMFQTFYENKIDTWDFAWIYSCWLQSGLTVLPHVNLVSNIGFDSVATHTRDVESAFANLPSTEMEFPLQHPPFMIRDRQADQFTEKTHFNPRLLSKIKRKIFK